MISVQDFYKKDLLRLPYISKKGDFRSELFSILELFLNEIINVEVPPSITLPTLEIDHIDQLINGIKKSVNAYLDGYPHVAYGRLSRVLKTNVKTIFLADETIPATATFYRLRKSDQAFSIGKKELFHIPYHIRTKVATQRYSIPGFPALYLANSIFVAWSEMGRAPIPTLQASRLKSLNDLTFLDLSTDVYTGKSNYISKSDEELWNHLKLWPLVFSCSMKVHSPNDNFKPEYIIPQLIMQYVRANNKIVQGIKYSSTHIDQNNEDHIGQFFNYVLPVVSNADSGHCIKLLKTFEMCEAIPWEMVDRYSERGSISASPSTLFSNISQIEIIKDFPFKYEKTPFAELEAVLNNLPLGPVI